MIRMGGTDAMMLSMRHQCLHAHLQSGDPRPLQRPRRLVIRQTTRISPAASTWSHVSLEMRPPLGHQPPDVGGRPRLQPGLPRAPGGLPIAGDHKSLCEFMSSVYAYQLDRSRPLWMSWVVEGLQDGKVAIVSLVHHAYVDGVGAAFNLQHLCRSDPAGSPSRVASWQPRPWPSWGKRLWWGTRDLPGCSAKTCPGGLRYPQEEGVGPAPGRWRQTAPSVHVDDAPHPLNVSLGGRSFVCGSLPLVKLKQAARRSGSPSTMSFLCCAAGVLAPLAQDWITPDQHPLIAGTPFAGGGPKAGRGWVISPRRITAGCTAR